MTMGVKVYVSGISGNKEVKKRQQRVLMILESRHIQFSVVDITEPGREPDKDFMQEKSTSLGATVSDTNPRHALPPQLFNDEQYCGDYDQFDMANEIDELEKFLKLAPSEDSKISNAEITLGNGTGEPEVESTEPEADSSDMAAVETSKQDEEEVVSTEPEIVESSNIPAEQEDHQNEDAEGEEENAEDDDA